jgi:tripartite-type tricarboxylate transporter receptor subunit TctC
MKRRWEDRRSSHPRSSRPWSSRTTPQVRPVLGRAVRAAALAAAAMLAGATAQAQSAADFYARHSVNLVIGYSVGGGYDLYARLLARYIGAHIPGSPTMLPQSMPGAGSLKAIMYLSGVAPKDGTVFGTFGRTMALEPLMSGAKFDPRKLSWIGSVTSEVSLCVTWASSPVKTWDDLMTKAARMGGQASGSDPDVYALILKNLFGSNLKLITGYPGNNDLALAMERSEIDGFCGLSWSSLASRHPDWLRDRKINLIVQAALEKDPQLPDTPLLIGQTDDPKKLAALKMILTTQALARPFAATPGVPPERLAALRTAFDSTVADPAFLAEARRLGLDVNPVGWQKINAMLNDIYDLPPDLVAMARQAQSR